MFKTRLDKRRIYDRSAHQRRSRDLLDKSLDAVVLLLKLSNLPLMRPARKRILDIIAILES